MRLLQIRDRHFSSLVGECKQLKIKTAKSSECWSTLGPKKKKKHPEKKIN